MSQQIPKPNKGDPPPDPLATWEGALQYMEDSMMEVILSFVKILKWICKIFT